VLVDRRRTFFRLATRTPSQAAPGRGKEVVTPQPDSAPTRSLPARPSLSQLRKQAKELLRAYRAGEPAAITEVERFERAPDPARFVLTDAQRVLARTYGFSSWPALRDHVDGVNLAALVAAAEAGDVVAVRRLAKARPDRFVPRPAGFCDGALRRAVLGRNEELTRVLMRLGANAHAGVWPHGDATSAYAIAVDREYGEIVATIEREEGNRRVRLGHAGKSTGAAVEELREAIAEGRAAEAIALMEADPALIEACDFHGVTPLHLAAWKHDPAMVGWLLDHGASPGALAWRDSPVRRHDEPVESGKSPLDFAAIVAGWAPEGRDGSFYFMENARVDPARFYETARLLLQKGAELTPRAAAALGDREAVLRLHREGRLPNEIHFLRGGLLAIAVRVSRLDMVATLLDLGLDPDESVVVTADGERSWGMPLWDASMCGRHEIAELLLARGADANGVVYACGDSICAAADETMTALLRRHGTRLTVETVTDPKTARAILDGTVTAYSLGDAEPLARKDVAEALLGGSDPEFLRMCLPIVTRKRDDPWWNGVLRSAVLPECFQLVLEHGVDPDVPGEGGYAVLHHLATSNAGRRGSFVPTDEQRLRRATMLLDAGASLTVRDSLLKSTPLGWACRWGRLALVQLYLARGADPREADGEP
jgi:ankyrin repeat protein